MNGSAETRLCARRTYSLVGVALFALAVISIGGQLALGFAARLLDAKGYDLVNKSWFIWALSFVPLYVIAMPCCLLFMRRIPAAPVSGTKMRGKDFFLFLLMCFPLMYAGNLIGNLLSLLLSGGRAQNALNEFLFSDSLLKIPVVVIVAPLLEEYIFRKLLIDRLHPYGEKAAILFSGLSFGLFHMNLFQFFYAFALGLLFAYVYTRTGKLRYSVLMHMVINFLGSAIAPFLLNSIDIEAITAGQLDMSMLPGLLGFLGYTVLLFGLSAAGLVMLIVKVPKFIFLPTEAQMERGKEFRTACCNAGVILFAAFCIGISIFVLLR